MARPARNNADYYTHSAHLRNDRRVKAIRTKLGVAGYGLLHMLLEALTDADYTQLSTEELELELLAGDFGVSVTEIHSLLQIAEKVGFLARNEAGFLVCPDLNIWLAEVFEKRNRARNAYKQAENTVSVTEIGVSVTETPQSKVKKIKVEKNISASAESELDSFLQNSSTAASPKPAEPWAVWVAENTPTVQRLKKPLTGEHYTKMVADFGEAVVREVLQAMENKADLLKRYTSANLTAREWCQRRAGAAPQRPQPQPQPVGPAPRTTPDLNDEVVAERQRQREAEVNEARRQLRARSLASS